MLAPQPASEAVLGLPFPTGEEAFALVGGVLASAADCLAARELLERSPGLMVRQPLARAGHPLAGCDYHAEAAPYRDAAWAALAWSGRRGAAGRPATKVAFMAALADRAATALADARLVALMPLAAEAFAAMRADAAYLTGVARAAVAIRERDHAQRQRDGLRAAQRAAMSRCGRAAGQFTCDNETACGTGRCPFATGVYRDITAPAGPGRTVRPVNHRGGPFSSASALAQLAELDPLRVAA